MLLWGISNNISQARIGANTASNNKSNETSAEVIYLGPVAIKQVAIGAKTTPRSKYRSNLDIIN